MLNNEQMDEGFYPRGPANVRPDLTRPSSAYKRHAYIAVAGVVLFLVAYAALAGWLAWTAYRLFSSLPRSGAHWILLAGGGVAASFLAILMIKSVFFVRRGEIERDIEIRAADHPRLFEFLYRLADEAKAPRPHRVFLSPRVNAGVYYDLSIANLIFPSKKNLEIGLGLVNVLTLAELKAVLAHEFGHFAQRTLAISRWVYVAQQIATHVVTKRDAFDRFLRWLSSIDVRIAWTGWLLRIVVWSIRSLIESVFGWVMLAKRALSREMELQADLVAVSLTGSDALVHALHRLEAADEAMDRALSFADEEGRAGNAIADIFAVQSEMIFRTRAVLGDNAYGEVPAIPATAPESHRLFKAQFAQPPRMWSTHPPNNVREENAKREYLAAPLDDRSAWLLFEERVRVRKDVTAWIYARVARDAAPAQRKKLETPPIGQTIERLGKNFDRRFFDAAYRGVYLGRSCVLAAENVSQLYGSQPASANIVEALDALYPATISRELEAVRDLTRERALLRGLERGILEASASGKIVRYRGQDYHRRELPNLITRVEREVTDARAALTEHDKRVRATHLAAARLLSVPWEDYLKGLAAILHYAEHREADLADTMGVLQNGLAIALADGRVSARELGEIVMKARMVHVALVAVHREAASVHLGALADKLGVENWQKLLGVLDLPPPTPHNAGPWLDAVGSWVGAACGALNKLSMAALDELLRAEREVAEYVKEKLGTPVPPAPVAPRVQTSYATLVTGKERPRQNKLGWWERFYIADGLLPGAARFACAGSIVGVILLAGFWVGDATVHVLNGLNRPVVVTIGDEEVTVSPHGHADVDIAPAKHVAVRARTTDGDVIEAFEAEAPEQLEHYIYDVAWAAPLVEYDPSPDQQRVLPVQRWIPTDATRVIDNPNGQQVPKTDPPLIFGIANLTSIEMLANARDSDAELAAAHVRWDPPGTISLEDFFFAAKSHPQFAALLEERLARLPDDVMALRYQQELGPRAEVCERHRKRAAELPNSAAWQYLAARCVADGAARNDAFAALAPKWPDHPWVMYAHASVLADRGAYDDADRLLVRVSKMLPEERAPVSLSRARIARLRGQAIPTALIAQEPMLASVHDAEDGGAEVRGSSTVYRALHRGDLAATLAAASGSPRKAAIAVMVACSDGASPLLIAAGALTADKIPDDVALYAYALAIRDGRDPLPYRKLVADQHPELEDVLAFVDHVHSAKPDELEKITPPVELVVRAHAYAAAAVMLGDATPTAWRTFAKRALFVFERPYLR